MAKAIKSKLRKDSILVKFRFAYKQYFKKKKKKVLISLQETWQDLQTLES